MRKVELYIPFLFSFLIASASQSQDISDITGNVTGNYLYWKASIVNSPLFDQKEITDRKISRCFILRKTTGWDNEIKIDSHHIYKFDKNGKIDHWVIFYPFGRDTISNYENNFKKVDSSVQFTRNIKEVTKYYSWAFNPQTEMVDTGFIGREVFDADNRLIEYQHFGTTDYHTFFFCGTGITIHEKFGYDKMGRMNYYENIHAREAAKISYFGNWRHVKQVRYREGWDSKGVNYKIYVREDRNEIVEKDDFHSLKMFRLHPGSQLFKKITLDNDLTEYLFVYEYIDTPQQGKNLQLYTTSK